MTEREYELWYVSDFSHLKKSYIIILKSKWLLLLILDISTPKWAWYSVLACSPEHIEKRYERVSVIGGKANHLPCFPISECFPVSPVNCNTRWQNEFSCDYATTNAHPMFSKLIFLRDILIT